MEKAGGDEIRLRNPDMCGQFPSFGATPNGSDVCFNELNICGFTDRATGSSEEVQVEMCVSYSYSLFLNLHDTDLLKHVG